MVKIEGKMSLINTAIPLGFMKGTKPKMTEAQKTTTKKKNYCRHYSMSHHCAAVFQSDRPSNVLSSLWLLSVQRQNNLCTD